MKFKKNTLVVIAIFLPVLFGIGWIKHWLGLSFWAVVPLYMGIGFVMRILFDNEESDRFFDTRGKILDNIYFGVKSLFLYIIFVIAFMRIDNPIEVEFVQSLFNLVSNGTLYLFAFYLVYFACRAVFNASLEVFIFPLLRGAFVTVVGISLVANFGDYLYGLAVDHPNDFVLGLIALSIITFISSFFVKKSGSRHYYPESVGSLSGVATGIFKQKLTEMDKKRIAAHESGHVLLYAAIDKIPDSVKVVINKDPDIGSALGYVSNLISQNRLESMDVIVWKMLVLLSGKKGEEVLMGGHSVGSEDDFDRWSHHARTYLKNHSDGVFYNEPKNDLEQASNTKRFAALQEHQLETLETYFNENVETLKNISSLLLEKEELTSLDLSKLLNSVKLTQGVPNISEELVHPQ